jgi:hypothetical protein
MRASAAVKLAINSRPGNKTSYWSIKNSTPRTWVRSYILHKVEQGVGARYQRRRLRQQGAGNVFLENGEAQPPAAVARSAANS